MGLSPAVHSGLRALAPGDYRRGPELPPPTDERGWGRSQAGTITIENMFATFITRSKGSMEYVPDHERVCVHSLGTRTLIDIKVQAATLAPASRNSEISVRSKLEAKAASLERSRS